MNDKAIGGCYSPLLIRGEFSIFETNLLADVLAQIGNEKRVSLFTRSKFGIF